MGVNRMLRLLRKLVGGDDRAKAEAAKAEALKAIAEAETQAMEIQPMVARVIEHGRRNHFGERIDAAFRRA